MLFSQQILELIRNGIGETLCMVIISTVISYMIGIPLGIILVVTDKEGIRPIPALQKVLGLIINLLRSVPFLILLIMMIPVTRKLVGTSLGWRAVVPPLVASAAPYIARMVESSFKEIDAGVIEAAKSMAIDLAFFHNAASFSYLTIFSQYLFFSSDMFPIFIIKHISTGNLDDWFV